MLAAAAAGVIFFVLLPHINAYQQTRVADCGIAVIMAVSLTVVNGFTGQFSIGHSGFMALGGYAAASLMYYGTFHWFGDLEFHGGLLSWSGAHSQFAGHLLGRGDWLFIGSLIFGGLIAAAIGWVVGLPSLRLRGDYLAIVTLGFCEIVRIVLQGTPAVLDMRPRQDPGADPADVDTTIQYLGDKHLYQELHHLGGALGFSGAPIYTTVFWITLVALLTLVMTIRLKYSSYGRAMLSIREDDIAAQAVGVNITKLKVRAFVFAAFFAGIAGGLQSMKLGTIDAKEMGFQRSFDFVIMVVLGGMGSISGATIAAIFITLMPEWLRDIKPGPWGLVITGLIAIVVARSTKGRTGPWIAAICWIYISFHNTDLLNISPAEYRLVLYAVLLIITMILRPQGLFGIREIWDYLPTRWQWWQRPERSGN